MEHYPAPQVALRAVAALLFLVGCDLSPGRPPAATLHDSSGVQIVENAAPAWNAGRAWEISREPILSIGVVTGPEDYQLDRVSGVLRVSDGRIVVATARSELRFYDADGRHLRTAAGQGQGPGEFRVIVSLFPVRGDSIGADDASQRAQLFTPEGDFVSATNLVGLGSTGRGSLQGWLADGSMLVKTVGSADEVVAGGEASAKWMATFRRVARSGEELGEVVTLVESVLHAVEPGGMPTWAMFGHSLKSALGRELLYAGSNERYEIGAYAPDGTLLRLIRRTWTPRPVTDDDVEAYITAMIAPPGARVPPAMLRRREERLHAQPVAETFPAFDHLLVDRAGNLWVRDYDPQREVPAPPATGPAGCWQVFDPGGVWLGTMQMPASFEVMDIGEDYVAGVGRTAEDVQVVRVYRLTKP